MQENEKKELFGKLNGLKKEISELKVSLNQVDEQKEKWFRDKEAFSRKIKDLIKEIREDKAKRNSLTDEVKKHKEKRKELNEKSKSKISDILKINQKEKEVIRKHHIKGDPSAIRAEMDRLELRIETEVMSFDKEKGIMKQIKGLKKRLDESNGLNSILSKKSDLSKEIDILKKEAKEVHKMIQIVAKESQVKHESIIRGSKEIDELKKKEEEAFQKFIEFKKKFNEINDNLKDKLTEMGKINEKLGVYKEESRKKRKEKEDRMLKNQADILNEKIKKREKLTTDDLLMFQNLKE